jgi:hypothetical protein
VTRSSMRCGRPAIESRSELVTTPGDLWRITWSCRSATGGA